MTETATVLYEFEGLTENGEISLVAGETVTVTNKSVGDGWWEGTSSNGSTGLFPEAYVQLNAQDFYQGNAADTPRYSNVPGDDGSYETTYNNQTSGGYNNQNAAGYNEPAAYDANPVPAASSYNNYDDQDGNWTDDWDDTSTVASTVVPQPQTMPNASKQYGAEAHDISSINSNENKSTRVTGAVSIKFNRFSSFVKGGAEDFMLGKADARVRQVDQIHVESDADGPHWRSNDHSFTISIDNPKEQSKMKGLKKFVAYKLTPSDTAVTVLRRYKHFDWLYEQFVRRYPMICIPRLPDKQAAGRFEEDFIEARMARLQLWVGYICKHPILSKSQIFRNFITLTEQKAWKMAKRQAEKDELAGASFFLTISIPPSMPQINESEASVEHFKKFAKAMDDSVSACSSASQNMAMKHSQMAKRDFHQLGKSISSVAGSFSLQQASSTDLAISNAVKNAGETYVRVGDMFAAQPKNDHIPLIDTLWLYKGLLDTMPDVWHMQSGAIRKMRECERLKAEGKMPESDLHSIKERTERIVGGMRAEIDHFHRERQKDFVDAYKDFLSNQVQFFESVTTELRNALGQFEELSYR